MAVTTAGADLLALPVQTGTTVITSDREFPANVYPWMGRDEYDFELIPTTAAGVPDEDALVDRLRRGDVSILAISAVQFTSGYRADLRRLGEACRSAGAFFVVDAIQALGHLPIDVREMGIDVLASGGHKWLLSPFGTGFAYVRSELIERMEPRVIGWTAMSACDDLEHLLDYSPGFRNDARRFEVATLPFQDLAAFAESLELLMEVGVPAIERHVLELLDRLERWLEGSDDVEILGDRSEARRSGILAFRPSDPQAVYRTLVDAGVVCALREGGIRIAPHLYSTTSDVERVMDVLAGTVAR